MLANRKGRQGPCEARCDKCAGVKVRAWPRAGGTRADVVGAKHAGHFKQPCKPGKCPVRTCPLVANRGTNTSRMPSAAHPPFMHAARWRRQESTQISERVVMQTHVESTVSKNRNPPYGIVSSPRPTYMFKMLNIVAESVAPATVPLPPLPSTLLCLHSGGVTASTVGQNASYDAYGTTATPETQATEEAERAHLSRGRRRVPSSPASCMILERRRGLIDGYALRLYKS